MNVQRTAARIPTTAAGAGQPFTLFDTRALAGRYGEALGVATALAIALFVRVHYLFAGTFPLNDGGLFYVMTRELQRAGYRLPASTSYNHLQIPFAYPPLGFYAAGLIASMLHIPLLTVFRFLPLVVDMACLAAFYVLARSLLNSKSGALIALFIFGLFPRSFTWLIMGGGVTRAFGVFFAILAIHRLYLMYLRHRARDVVFAALFCALTLLSHVETAYFLAVTAVLLLLWLGRGRRALIETAAVGAGTLLLTAPWWLVVIGRDGPGPFLHAAQTTGNMLNGVLMLVRFDIAGEGFFPLLSALALLGALVCWRRSRCFLVYWLVAILLLDPRAAPNYAAIPLALLAATGMTEVILPFLASQVDGRRLTFRVTPDGADWKHGLGGPSGFALLVVLGAMVLYATAASAMAAPETLGSLTAGDREAMQWVSSNSPLPSRFAVITGLGTPASSANSNGEDRGLGWAADRWSEWFPALTNRDSVATSQGYEWLGGLAQQQLAYIGLQECAGQDTQCLAAWSSTNGASFDYVYVARKTGAIDSVIDPHGCCERLRQSLLSDPSYRLVYDSSAATIFVRAESPE